MSKTLVHMFSETVEKYGSRPALKHKVQGLYQAILFQELFLKVEKLTALFVAMHLPPQSKIAILSENRPEWVVADLAIQAAGHVVVPIYPTLSAEQLEYILKHSESVLVLVSTRKQLRKAVKASRHLANQIWIMDHIELHHASPEGQSIGDSVHNLETLLQRTAQPVADFFKKQMETLQPDSLASLIYTSGTTGEPKGVMLTHTNFVTNVQDAQVRYPFERVKTALSVLPLSHAFERTCGYYCVLFSGICIAYAESQASIADNILEIKPQAMIAVPRLFEKIYSKVIEQASHSPVKKMIFNWAVKNPKNPLATLLVFSKIKKKTGGNIIFFVSGGAALNPEIANFFTHAGLPVCEGYGLTETSPVVASNPFDANRPGTIGTKFKSVEIKIAEDGELLVKGPSVMRGYFKNPTATAEAIDSAGWLHTGDLASQDSDGYLKIIGRKKELLVLSNGKKIVPAAIEAKLTSDPHIVQAVLVAEGRKFVSAILVPDWAKITSQPQFEKYKTITEPVLFKADVPDLCQFFDPLLHQLMKPFAQFEQIKNYMLLPQEFTEENGFLTPSLKVKKNKVYESYKWAIEKLYQK
jgi:long-chain acyl-CoA synthetase